MIRVTIDLHVISRGCQGGYWVSTLPKHEWERYLSYYTWCSDDGELRAELRERFGESFILIREGVDAAEAISEMICFNADVELITGWPTKLNLEEELNA